MKWLNCEKMRFVLVGFVAITVISNGLSKADFTFGEPTNLGSIVNSSSHEEGPYITPDVLSLYYSSTRTGGQGDYDLWVSKRSTVDEDWASPVNLGSNVNSSAGEYEPYISPDGLHLYFYSNRSGGYGSYDLWVATRQNVQDEWSASKNVGSTINGSMGEKDPVISADGLELYFCSNRSGGYGDWDIWVATRQTIDDEWQNAVNVGPMVNSLSHEAPGSISADGLILLLDSERPGGYGSADIWMTRRETKNSPWEEPLNLGQTVNGSSDDALPRISFDRSWLYFSDFNPPYRPGGFGGEDIWQAQIIPIVDLNADGIVDAVDICIMVDHWGEDYSLCDIGPTPFGDGVVDVEDLKVLAKHLFEEVDDPTLMAHWALDETEGIIAYDSARVNDAVVVGGTEWQPNGGQVDGALQLDGIDGYAVTGLVLNPADGPFSIFAWIKGVAPGQVIVSQQSAANWLTVDADGNLMTELKQLGRLGESLLSQTCITDGQWHRIGLVWDGSHRMLYVDDVVVAEDTQDTQNGLIGSNNGLYIGCGMDCAAGTYFSGLIDDVRIYNRAVKP